MASDYLKKYNRCILEYTSLGSTLDEDDPMAGSAPADPMAAGGADPMAGGAAPADPMAAGGADPMAGGAAPADPMAAGGADPMAGGAAPADPMAAGGATPGAPAAGGAPADPMAGGINPQAEANQDNAVGGPITPGAEQDGDKDEEDEEGESEDKEEAERNIEKLTSKFSELLHKIDSIEGKVDDRLRQTNDMISSLRGEMERRNPSPEEKMTMRSVKSGPFNETPEDYWQAKKFDPNSNYSPDDDHNGEDMPKYKITRDDVDNFRDWSAASKTFDGNNLRDILGY